MQYLLFGEVLVINTKFLVRHPEVNKVLGFNKDSIMLCTDII